MIFEEASWNVLKSYLSFRRCFESSDEEKRGGNRKKRFYSEM